MTNPITISSAGNVLPAALGSLRALGYDVTLTNNGRLCKAEKDKNTFVAEDPVLLLGLVKLHEVRGSSWQPTDAEVERYLAFDATYRAGATNERVDVWEEQGAVHILCVDSFGDPVELSADEARAFAVRLDHVISEAG
jgi:hypothetical protein